MHGAVAARLAADETLVGLARERVREWRTKGTVHAAYVDAWEELLGGPLDALLAALTAPSERMHDLRQVSPFAGLLDARERWRILRGLRP